MSKKRGNKKNQDIDDDFEESTKINVEDTDKKQVTSKPAKGKSAKKGKGKKDNDWSDNDEKFDIKKAGDSEDEFTKPAAKKSQKKCKFSKISYDTSDSKTLQAFTYINILCTYILFIFNIFAH